MGIFSKFRGTGGDGGEVRVGESGDGGEKGLMESVGEMLEHSVHNVKEAVFGHVEGGGGGEGGDIGGLPRGLAMEDPFSQSDHVLVTVVEHDVRSGSGGGDGCVLEDVERKSMVQTVRENLAHSAHIVRDAVRSHTGEVNGSQFAQAAAPIEDGDNGAGAGGGDDHRRTIIEAMGEIISHPVQTVKDIIGSHNDVVEGSSIETSTGAPKQESSDSGDLENGKENGEPEEVKGLIQTVKEAAKEVKEEMLEVVQEVKDVVMSNDTLPNVQTESITEDAGERPSMELVHTIVHD
ncbi:hypothetical protein M758_3G242500 [Ceratodon purpureus]|nr:hypothetical protein M758_3G242500 [Ceratodon purpureus]